MIALRVMTDLLPEHSLGESASERDGGGHAPDPPARDVGDEHGGDAAHDRG